MVYKVFLRSIITYLILIITSPLENKAEHKRNLINGFCIASIKSKLKFEDKKLSDNISDNELKSKIITAINNYFDVSNWEYGENFYFTELSSYIHQTLGSSIGSIVILPKNTTGRFGEMFQVKAEPNELFLSTASVSDIEIVSRLDNQSLK